MFKPLIVGTVPARVLVKKQRPIWLEQFISKENTVKTEQHMKAMSGKGQNRIRENDRKTYAFPGFERHRVVETTNSTHAPK